MKDIENIYISEGDSHQEHKGTKITKGEKGGVVFSSFVFFV